MSEDRAIVNENGYTVMECKNCHTTCNTSFAHSLKFCSIRCENFYEGMIFQEDSVRLALIASGKAL